MGNVGDGLEAGNARWSFGGQTAQQFDSHIAKSVPSVCRRSSNCLRSE